jgi:cytochrome P450
MAIEDAGPVPASTVADHGRATRPRGPKRHPARPPWRDFFTIHRMFGTGVLPGLAFLHGRYGSFVRTRLPLQLYFISDPACVEEILVKKPELFQKDRTTHLLSRVVGQGLLVNEGEPWRRQRRLLQPAFHTKHLQSYADVMVSATARATGGWRAGEVRDVHEDMMGVTLAIVAETLFGADVSSSARDIGLIIADLMEEFGRILGVAAMFQPPVWVPTKINRHFRRSRRKLDELIRGIIAQRRKGEGGERDDLLSLLVRARDEDGGTMTDAQVRDEAVTLFLAGHETTALALSYALYLLATHPDRAARLAAEVDEVTGGRPPAFGDLERLSFTEAVVLESMRLYPPAWVVARQALVPVEIGGYAFPKGAQFVMSPFIIHRDPRTFEEPEAFRPERWAGDLARRLPRFAYFPFGGGPRVCIGNRFAMMEAKLVLAVLAQRLRFEVVPETELALLPSVTLRPRRGVRLRLAARA